jgi:hypothetical protein
VCWCEHTIGCVGSGALLRQLTDLQFEKSIKPYILCCFTYELGVAIGPYWSSLNELNNVEREREREREVPQY